MSKIKVTLITKILVKRIFKKKYNKNKQMHKNSHKHQMSLLISNKYNIKTLENLQGNLTVI